ncbi:zinc finger CCCH domain-containing protein 14 isoform 3-T3 [Discoglossus pictus]
MEIGTEISRKIRTAIKGKLQELGAYVDEELPDYIMVMVANKKSQTQMTDDLSLFLGNNTTRFTTWLQGVLDKLRTVTPESNNLKASEAIIFESSLPSLQSLSQIRTDVVREAPALTVSSTRHETYEVLVPTSLHEQRASGTRSSDNNLAARLTSAVKPLRELSSSEAVIDLKPDVDDSFDDDLSFASENAILSRRRPVVTAGYKTSRPTAEVYRPPGSGQQIYRTTESSSRLQRLPQGSVSTGRTLNVQSSRHVATTRQYDPPGARSFYRSALRSAPDRASREEENSRKRKIPVASSVVKVKKYTNDGEEEEEEDEEEDNLSRAAGISSSVSVPARPERRPSLPPNKQANKNLILKAISEAQESITKTTNYSTAPSQKQTVPVAPRTRLHPDEELALMQSRSSIFTYQVLEESPEQRLETEEAALHRLNVLSRLQLSPAEDQLISQDSEEAESQRAVDSRSFILKRPKLSREAAQQTPSIPTPTAPPPAHEAPSHPGRLIQPRETATCEKPPSPKFIVTLDGVPSPPGYASDQEQEEDQMVFTEQGETYTETYNTVTRGTQNYQMQLLGEPLCDTDAVLMDTVSVATKEKIHERCKYWPACKNADSCAYHHPTAPCKSFPKCRFADKCFFIHPNCKYDAKCTKADCPYTHASRRMPAVPVKKVPVAISHPAAQICKFFPACKKTECAFYHPKHCRFNTLCRRADCKYYHPSVNVPPRHALTWTRAQASE